SSASERQAAAFLKGLSETGYLEGQSVAVAQRSVRSVTNHLWLTSSAAAWLLFPQQAAILPRLRPRPPTTTIPIVFSVANDPVQLGLVVSLARARKRTSAPCYIGHEQSSARLGLAPIQRRVIP